MRTLGRAMVALLGIAAIAVLAVVAVDAWRESDQRPEQCASLLLEPARGDQRDDAGIVSSAWHALTGRDSAAVGSIDGSRPVLGRSCLAYAGRTGDASTVVFLESTQTGASELLRIAEVRLGGGGAAQRATVGYPVLIGRELAAGIVLPLSGAYLAPADVAAVEVIGPGGGAGAPARRVADGLFDLGVVADRTLAPENRVPDAAAALVLERTDAGEANLAVLPVGRRDGDRAVRVPLALTVDDRPRTDPATQRAVLAVLPSVFADPRLPSLLGQLPGHPELAVRTAALTGGRGVTVAAGGPAPAPGLPVFRYFVPDAGPVVAAG